MAPSQSQIVTFVSGSALLVCIAFALYLIRRRNKKSELTEVPVLPENTNKNANEEQECEEDIYPVQEDTSGPPFPDYKGLTVSTSWAILNDMSTTSSPQLSPVDSVTSVILIAPNSGTENEGIAIINGEENSNLNASFEMDDTQGATVLENPDDDTLLEPPEIGRLLSQLSTSEHETVAVDVLNLHYEQLLKEYKASELQKFTTQEVTEALMASQNPSQCLTERNAEVLVGMLTFDDIYLKRAALQGIANCTTFTHNQNVLHEKGCLPCLASLLELQHMLWLQQANAPSAVSVTINTVTSLAVNEQNNKEMESCVPSLVDISLDKDIAEAVCLSSLQALTNLSIAKDHHNHYTRLVHQLYQFLDVHNTGICLQALKILVNLSSNADMVPHLLAAKAPDGLLEYLQPSLTEEPVLLRFVTLLANILHAVKESNITSSSLPPNDKAALPETMYSALFGISAVSNLKNKVFLLCKHTNPEVQQQAVWVYNLLK